MVDAETWFVRKIQTAWEWQQDNLFLTSDISTKIPGANDPGMKGLKFG